jgi:hypothetical protein
MALVVGFRNCPARIFEVGHQFAVLSVLGANVERDLLSLLG